MIIQLRHSVLFIITLGFMPLVSADLVYLPQTPAEHPTELYTLAPHLPYIPVELCKKIFWPPYKYPDKQPAEFATNIQQAYVVRRVSTTYCALMGTILNTICLKYESYNYNSLQAFVRLNDRYKTPLKTLLKETIGWQFLPSFHKTNYRWVQLLLENDIDIGTYFSCTDSTKTVLTAVLDEKHICLFQNLLVQYAHKITWTHKDKKIIEPQ